MGEHGFFEGQFYEGTFLLEEFTQIFSEIGVDRRVAVLLDIEPRGQVSQLVMTHNFTGLVRPDDLGTWYNYFYVHTSGGVGSFVGSTSAPQFTDKTDEYLNCGIPPTYLTFTDENQNARYVTVNASTHTLVASATVPNVPDLATGQFIGGNLEWIADDGQTIYNMTVTSNNVIHLNFSRVEPQRMQQIRVSNGIQFAFDGTNVWHADLISVDDISMEIPEVKGGFAGVAIARVGSIRLQLSDQTLDYLINQSWNIRNLVMRMGRTDQDITTYRIVLRGQTERAEANLNELTIVLRDHSVLLKRTMQDHSYAGTGGYEGGASQTGILKPVIFGFCRHIEPVLVDEKLSLYQVHDGPTQYIYSVYTGGRVLGYGGGLPSGTTSLTQWTPTQSEVNIGAYRVDLPKGMFRLSAPPTAVITTEVFGDTSVPTDTNRASHVISGILKRKVPELQIDQSSFDQYYIDQIGWAGVYVKDGETIEDVLNNILLQPLGALLKINSANVCSVRKVTTKSPVAIFTDLNVTETDPPTYRPGPIPGSKYRVGYLRAWRVLSQSEFVGAPSTGLFEFLSQKYRYREIEWYGGTMTRKPVWDSAEDIIIESPLDDFYDAGHLASWMSHRDHALQGIYEFTVLGYSFGVELGDTVAFQITKLNIHDVKTGIVIGIVEKSPTDSQEDFTRFTVWA